MNVQRSEVLVVSFPWHEGTGFSKRPAVVIQSDYDNQRLGTTVVAMITTSTRLVGREPRHVLIDITTPDGRASGLRKTSIVNCSQVVVVDDDRILKHLGHLPDSLMDQVSNSVRHGLDL